MKNDIKNSDSENSNEPKKNISEKADAIIKKHIYVSSAVGLIPLPFIDFMGVTGVQLNLLRRLANEYNVPFNKDIVKQITGSLIGGGLSASVGARLGTSLTKIIPGPGMVLGAVSTSTLSAATTYAVGKVFKRHFEDGGTFLTFDPEKAREYYRHMFKEGERIVSEIKSKPQV
ncbi:hypothetical protein MCHI_002620 [Candidatus Magnetoovum chiemensis]|nr:hypothetical protein MCHI_002620 [Candidatus Magnetoovum chiemensis]